MIAPDEQSGAAAWGYSIQFMRLLDSGGTVFSDALLSVHNVVSRVPMDERLYDEKGRAQALVDHLSGETAEYVLYSPKYTLPFGTVIKGKDDLPKGTDIVSLHNSIYASMLAEAGAAAEGLPEEIAVAYVEDDMAIDGAASTEVKTGASEKKVDSTIRISGESALYLLGNTVDKEYENTVISVEDKDGRYDIAVPTLGEPDNMEYPAHFNNNAVYLGAFKDESVKVSVSVSGEKDEYPDVKIIGIDLDALEKICDIYKERTADAGSLGAVDGGSGSDMSGGASGTGLSGGDSEDAGRVRAGKRTLEISASASSGDSYLLLPLTYDKGWKVKVNGKKVKVSAYAGLFTLIPLKEGDNLISMKFTPKGTVSGRLLSIVTLAVVLVYIVLAMLGKTGFKRSLDKAVASSSRMIGRIYSVVFAAVLLLMYVIPVFYGIIRLIIG